MAEKLVPGGFLGAGGFMPPVPGGVANWPLDQIAYFMLDGDAGDDANPGFIVAAPGTVFSPAQIAATAVKTTDRLAAVRPILGNGRKAITLVKPRAGRAVYDKTVVGDGLGAEDRSAYVDYALFQTRGSDLTNSAADHAQLGCVTTVGPFTVLNVGSGVDGYPMFTLDAPIGIAPSDMSKYRLRFTTPAPATIYASPVWGDTTGAGDPAAVTVWLLPGFVPAGSTVVFELCGSVLHDFIEMDEIATISNPTSPPSILAAGLEVTNRGRCVVGVRTPSTARPLYTMFSSLTLAEIVGDLDAGPTYINEIPSGPGTLGGPSMTLEGGGIGQGDYAISISYARVRNSLTLRVTQADLSHIDVDMATIRAVSQASSLGSIHYDTLIIDQRSVANVTSARWKSNLGGLIIDPNVSADNQYVAGKIDISNVKSMILPEPAVPGIILKAGHYTVALNHGGVDTPLVTVGSGVRVEHDQSSSTFTVVDYATLHLTGFEIEGAQKVVCLFSGQHYQGNEVLPCPRGMVMRMVDAAPGAGGTAYPCGLVVKAVGAGDPSRFDLALDNDVNVIGYTLTNLVQGEPAIDNGWTVVANDGIGVLQKDPAAAAVAPGDVLYLSKTVPGYFTGVATSTRLGVALPIGPGSVSPIPIFTPYTMSWLPQDNKITADVLIATRLGLGVATVTSPEIFHGTSASTVASAAGATWNEYNFAAETVSITGNTGIATATGFNKVAIAAPTIAGGTATCTITHAATVAISGAPSAGANVAITNAYALWSQAGVNRFDGYVGVGLKPTVGVHTNLGIFTGTGDPVALGFASGPGEIAAVNTAANTRFDFGQSGSRYATVMWVYNATLDSAYLGIGTAGNLNPIFLNARTLQFKSTATVANAAGAVWNGMEFQASTLTVTGAGTITALSFLSVASPVVTSAAAAVVTDFYTARIAAATFTGAGPARATRSYALFSDGNTKLGGGFTLKGTDVNAAGPYVVLETDYYLEVRYTGTGAISINLPAISLAGNGRTLVVIDSGYNAAANNITVVRDAADKINNVAGNYVISASGAAVRLKANATTSNWELV
jgi:hypothetical protein